MKKEAKKEQRRVEKKQLRQQGFHPDRIKQIMAERRAESKAQKEARKRGRAEHRLQREKEELMCLNEE